MKGIAFNQKIIMKKIFLFMLFFAFLLNFSLPGKINLSRSAADSVFPAIAVNSAGEIMVVWTEWNSGQVHYAINRNGNWTSMRNAGLNGRQAWSNEIVADSHGTFHMTSADGNSSFNRDIAYSYFQGDQWSPLETIYFSPYNSAWNKMAVDTNDDIHVIWYHSLIPKTEGVYKSNAVTMAKPRMGTWPSNITDVSHTPDTESIHPAIAVLNRNIYTCWMDGVPRRIYYNEKTGGTWRAPKYIESGYYPDIAVDNSGNVHIVFSNWSGNLWYISRVNGTWRTKESISNGESPLQFAEIQHKNNVIVAAWVQGANGNWSVHASAKLAGGRWQIPVKIGDAPGGGEGNKHVHLALDNKNCAHFIWEGIGVGGKNDIFYEKYCMNTPTDATFIEVDNSYLGFHTADSSSSPSDQTFRVRASGAGSINYTITGDKGWLSVSPAQGSSFGEWDSVTVRVNSAGLGDGTYDAKITIADPDAYNNPVDIGVTLTIGEGQDEDDGTFLETDKANLSFKVEEGKNPPAKSFNLRAKGGQALNYSVTTSKPWLTASPQEGTVSSSWTQINVSIEADQMKPGNFKSRINVTAPGASNKATVFVDLTVEKSKNPSIQLDRSKFYFWGYAHGDNDSSSSFRIRNSGSQTLQYKITSNRDWLKTTPAQGNSTGEWDTIDVMADSIALEAGKHVANIQITASGADNTPQSINVEFEVVMPPQPYPPVGITVKRMNHEGLVFQDYKSKIEWSANSRNNGLFTIVKYYVFRKLKNQHNPQWIFVGEVPANVFFYYDGGFLSKEERNGYDYTVSAVDSSGKESMRPESMEAFGTLENESSSQTGQMKKDSRANKKIR
jgi:hypothetical protein